jgi:hypothetical protein
MPKKGGSDGQWETWISGYGYLSTKLGEITRMPYSGETGAGTAWGWGVGLAMG